MAAVNTMSSMTIWHQDILDITCSYLDTSSIKALRLVRHDISDIATPFLFHTLHLGLRHDRLERLRYLSRHEKFSTGVCEVVWDTSFYSGGHDGHASFSENLFVRNNRPPCLMLDFSTESKKRREQKDHVLARYEALGAEEVEIINSDLLGTLTSAFKTMSKLKRLGFLGWGYPLSEEGHVYSRYVKMDPSRHHFTVADAGW